MNPGSVSDLLGKSNGLLAVNNVIHSKQTTVPVLRQVSQNSSLVVDSQITFTFSLNLKTVSL